MLCCGGNQAAGKGIVIAFSFDGHFDFINKLEFDDQVSKIRRLTCSDIFLVGGWDTLFFTQYSDRKMTKLSSINSLCDGLITSIECVGQHVYVLENQGKQFRRVEFGFELENYTPPGK